MTKLQIADMPPRSLKPNPWNTNRINDPENEKKLDQSLSRYGVFKPILVRTLPNGDLQILGGEHRWHSAQRLNMKTVPVLNLGLIDDQRAKEIGLVDNGRYGQDDTLGLAGLLRELGNDILTVMPYTEADIQNIMTASAVSLDDLDKMGQDERLPDLQELKVAPTGQVMRFKVPVEDVAWAATMIEREMKMHNFTEEDSLTNAGHALISLFKQLEKYQRGER